MIKMQVIKSGTATLGNPSLMWVDTSDSYTVKVLTDNGCWKAIEIENVEAVLEIREIN